MRVPRSKLRSPFHGLSRTAPHGYGVNVGVAVATPMFYRIAQGPGRSACYQVVENSSDRHPAAQIDRSSVDQATETQGRRFFSAIERGLVDRQPLHLGFSDHPR